MRLLILLFLFVTSCSSIPVGQPRNPAGKAAARDDLSFMVVRIEREHKFILEMWGD